MPSDLPLVSVVVVNYNGRDLLPACLESLAAQTYPAFEVILVDNASTDDSVEWVEGAYPEARVVRLDQNRGFTGGCNAGIRAARGEILATLNTDAAAAPRWLEAAVAALRDRPDVGMVASRIVFAHAPDVVESAGIVVDRAGVAWERLNGEPAEAADVSAEVFGPSGCAALYRRALLDDVGPFDEDFFLYLEDVDLAWRARLAGWRAAYAPEARVVHRHSATSGANSAFKRFLLARNRVWLLAKNYPSPAVWLCLPTIIGYDCAVVAAALVGSTNAADGARPAPASGRVAGLRGLFRALRKRRDVQRRRRVPAWRFWRQLEPLSPPWTLVRRQTRLDRQVRLILSGGSAGDP